MRRISIIGSSGSGKTTVAHQISSRLSIPHVELDSIYHQPGWESLPDDQFRERVAVAATAPSWVIDGNYHNTGAVDEVWDRADTVIWLDLRRAIVMRRVVVRTIRRAITREELWNGNREPMSNFYSLDPHKNIILWTWTRHGPRREDYEGLLHSGRWSHCDVYRLRSSRAVKSFLSSL